MQLTMESATAPCYKGVDILRDELYRGDELVLLDCRGNEEYKRGHIKGAYNIILPQLMMRRLKGNKLPLKNLVPPNVKLEKEAFLQKISTNMVIVYDQYTSQMHTNDTSMLGLLHKRMQHEGCKVMVLKGGYSRFHADHPEFCSAVPDNHMTDDADDEEGSSSSGTHSGDDLSVSPQCNRCSPPVLGLGNLRITDNTSHASDTCDAKLSLPVVTASSSLLARRSRRSGRVAPTPLTINSEGESENVNSTASSSSDIAPLQTPLSSTCTSDKSYHKLIPNSDQESSPSAFPTYGNALAPVEILPSLFLGCARDAASKETLRKYNISYILNVTSNLPNVFEDDDTYHYKQISISDHWSQNLSQFFPDCISFIDEARSKNCGVLVHCLAGISRSVTVTVAYLMQKKHWSLNDAYDFVKQRKSNVSPNFNFMGQLLDFEKTLGITEKGGDSGISSSSSSSNSPPTLFFTSPPPPTPSPLPSTRSMFCLPAAS